MNNSSLLKYCCIFLFFLLMGSLHLQAQSTNPGYDKALADSLGADDYGMKMYVLVILKSGTAKMDKAKTDSLFGGHMKNIQRMAELGKLIVAGPFQKNENDFRGLFILNVKTKDEANDLLQTDPAIKAGLLSSELYPWYGSAALPMYLPSSKKIEKTTF